MKKLMMLGFLTCPLLAHAYVLPICESDTFSQTIKQKYDSIDCGSHHGLFITENAKNLLGAIDNKGKIIIDNEYEQIDVQDNYPYFYIQKNNLWGVADNKGKILIPPRFSLIMKIRGCLLLKNTVNGGLSINIIKLLRILITAE